MAERGREKTGPSRSDGYAMQAAARASRAVGEKSWQEIGVLVVAVQVTVVAMGDG